MGNNAENINSSKQSGINNGIQCDIPMPSIDEKRRSIDVILQALPEKQPTFSQVLLSTAKRLGLRGLFFGVGDAAFIALIASVILAASFVGLSEVMGERRVAAGSIHSGLFMISPLVYILLHSLTVWKERISGVWEVVQVCRISLRHLTAIRMFCFGGAGAAICALLSGVLSIRFEISFFLLLGISLSSLFLFAAVFLFLIRAPLKVPRRIVSAIPLIASKEQFVQALCIGLWLVPCVVYEATRGSFLGQLLMDLPVAAPLGLAALLIAIFTYQVRAIFTSKGDNNYAIG